LTAHELIPLSDRNRWEAALAGVPHGPAHTWSFAAAVGAHCLYRYERDEAVIVCPLTMRRTGDHVDVTTPLGFSGFAGRGFSAQFAADWNGFAGAQGWICAYVGLHPVFCDASGFSPVDVFVHNWLYLLDLSGSEADLMARMSRNRRRQLRDSRRQKLVTDRMRLTEFLVATHDEFFERKGGSPRLPEATLRQLALLPEAVVVGADGADGIESLVAVPHTRYCADSLFAISAAGAEHHAARLHWYAIEQLRAIGVPVLNMGGGLRPGDGVTEFKRRFGAREFPLRSVRQVFDAEAYRRLCRERGVEPASRGYFPAYR
jgi:hypothetical protein